MADKDPFVEFLKTLDIDLSDKGLAAPELEQIPESENISGAVLKVSYDLYLFLDHAKPKYYMLTSNQHMRNLGVMSLKDALIKFSKLSNKKKS